jgi:hypothetical protein
MSTLGRNYKLAKTPDFLLTAHIKVDKPCSSSTADHSPKKPHPSADLQLQPTPELVPVRDYRLWPIKETQWIWISTTQPTPTSTMMI